MITALLVILLFCQNCLAGERLQISENNSTKVFVELLRGRDGLPGPPGPPGPPGKEGSPGPKSGGTLYVRWGKSSCPSTGAELVYSGYTGGSWYDHKGGGANYQCMPKDPEYILPNKAGHQGHGIMYGAEYQTPVNTDSHDHNVPCAVCSVPTRNKVLMIPAKYYCPPSWTSEYHGYLMSEYHGYQSSTFECVDNSMEHLDNGAGNTNGALFYHIEVKCGYGLPCPPYDTNKELNCVVCTQ